MADATLLVELLTEELPPKALKVLGQAFGDRIAQSLVQAQLTSAADAAIRIFATPRRLGVAIADVLDRAADRIETKKLMPAKVAYDASGAPTAAMMKRLEKEGAELSSVSTRSEAGVDHVWLEQKRAGVTLAVGLQHALDDALAKLPIPKRMSYQLYDDEGRETTVQFVRPAHALVAMHGSDVVPVHALGIEAGNHTAGHRFLGTRQVTLRTAEDYAETLRRDGKVIANFAERRDLIRGHLLQAAGNDRVVMPDALLDEVTALIEWPMVYRGTFDERFLDVPQECLILTMQQNQKYFALTDASGAIVNRFLVVSNMETDDPSAIIGGNERVLRARLADAKFFYDQDRKKTLESRVEKLKTVVYHNRLGTLGDRAERIREIARGLASFVGDKAILADLNRAATLSKADLLTNMVGEFPELQGIMGRYYAEADRENSSVSQALEEQYLPRFSGDALPSSKLGVYLSLADKTELISGMVSIGKKPTGDKDPFGLRRAALGIFRILLENDIELNTFDVSTWANSLFEDNVVPPHLRTKKDVKLNMYDDDIVEEYTEPFGYEVYCFIEERARNYFRALGYDADLVEAALSERPFVALLLLKSLKQFKDAGKAYSLVKAHKRIRNILGKTTYGHIRTTSDIEVDPLLFGHDSERKLLAVVDVVSGAVKTYMERAQFDHALTSAEELSKPLADLFDTVLINAPDEAVKRNRIALLSKVAAALERVARFSELVV